MTINSRIEKLEQKFHQRRQQQQGEVPKPIPEKWEEFVKSCTIRSGGKMVKFTPYPYQSILSSLMDTYSNIVVVKSRQLGITQAVSSKFLHRACLSPAYSSIMFLRNQEDASALARRTRQMLGGVKDYAVPDSDNMGYLKLKGKGEIYFKNSSKEGSRSYDSVLDFLFDEAAFSENIEQIYAASSPSGALAGDSITKLIVSTPSAKTGWYWDKLNEHNKGEDIEELCKEVAAGNLFKEIPGCYWFEDEIGTIKLILHWSAHPTYNKKINYLEYRRQQDGTDEETIAREYDLRFIDSAVSVFSAELIKSNVQGSYENEPTESANYYLGIDTATTGTDYFTGVLVKETNNKYSLAKLYRKRQESSEYHLYQLGEIIEQFQPKIIAVETTGGVGTLYLEELSKRFKSVSIQSVRTTGDTKPLMISKLQLLLEQKRFSYPSNSPLIDELLSFRRVGKRLEASPGKHDDVIMGACFALSVGESINDWNFNAANRFRLKLPDDESDRC